MSVKKRAQLTQDELVETDRCLRELEMCLEDAERLQQTGLVDMGEKLTEMRQIRDGLTALKAEFAPGVNPRIN